MYAAQLSIVSSFLTSLPVIEWEWLRPDRVYGGDRPLELKNPAQWRGRFVSVVMFRPHVRLSDRHLTETAGCPRLTPDLHDIYDGLINIRGLKVGQGFSDLFDKPKCYR